MASLNLARDVILRWDDLDPGRAPLLREGGVTAVLADNPSPESIQLWEKAGIRVVAGSSIRFASLEELDHESSAAPVVLQHGLWPGAGQSPLLRGEDAEVAGASRQPWIDANQHWIAWLRALYPGRPAVLGYLPDSKAGVPADRLVPYDTLELALTEARAAGGNYILALEPGYREALLKSENKALEAWRRLGRTARWLDSHAAYFDCATVPIITTLVAPGEPTAEIANLLFRQNASPALDPLAEPPPPAPRDRLAIVAVNLPDGRPAAADGVLAHAEAGSTVVLDDGDNSTWWRTARIKEDLREHDRTFYRLGKGRLLVYGERILDPSDFALDVIDVVTHKRRAVRLWGTGTVVATLRQGSEPGRTSLVVVNYGSQSASGILVYVQGNYRSAQILRPEADAQPLPMAKRGTCTEITVPELQRVGIVEFKQVPEG